MKANRILLVLFTAIQVLGFSLLWTKMPNTGEVATTPHQLSVDILDKLDVLTKQKALKLTQQYPDTDTSMTMVTTYPDAESFRSAIQVIIKEELSIALKNQPMVANAAYSKAGQAKEEAPLTPEQAQQRQESMMASRSILEQAISEGQWNNEDVEAMTPYVKDLSNSQREELIQLYLQGIGEKAMSEGVPPPPL